MYNLISDYINRLTTALRINTRGKNLGLPVRSEVCLKFHCYDVYLILLWQLQIWQNWHIISHKQRQPNIIPDLTVTLYFLFWYRVDRDTKGANCERKHGILAE